VHDCTTSRRQHRLPTTALSVGSTTVAPVSSVRDLGIFVGSDLVMRSHVCGTVSSCFAALRQLRSIRHLVSATVFQSLVAALVLCRLDYGNGTLVNGQPPGLPCPPTPVGPERCSATGIPSPPIWPHHGCARQPPLAASDRKDYFQGRRSDLSGSTWLCPAVLATVHIDRRHPVSTKISVFNFWRAMCSCC